jgi:lactobin A/cerein 7B family class IIb bacteriocin
MTRLKLDDMNEVLDAEQLSDINGGIIPQLVGAFTRGYRIGTAADEAFGISDWIVADDDHPIITPDVRNAGKPQ